MSRWVRVQTSIFDHELFSSAELSQREAWLWLIANVAWKETRHRVGNEVLAVPVGSMFATLRSLQTAWNWKSDKRVRSFLAMLESEQMIELKSDAGKTQISICNYSKYQDVGRSEDASGTQDGRSADALKTPVHQDTNTSSLRSDGAPAAKKKAARLPESWSLPRAWGQWAISEGYAEAVVRVEAEKFRDYWISKSGKDAAKLDWFATWRNWLRGCSKQSSQRGQAPPKPESDFMRHQRECTEVLERNVHGNRTNDQPSSNGTAFDLEPGNWRAH